MQAYYRGEKANPKVDQGLARARGHSSVLLMCVDVGT